jgi:hypothetical protein
MCVLPIQKKHLDGEKLWRNGPCCPTIGKSTNVGQFCHGEMLAPTLGFIPAKGLIVAGFAFRSFLQFSFDVFCNGKFDHCGRECVFRGLVPHHWQRNMSMRAHVHLYSVG